MRPHYTLTLKLMVLTACLLVFCSFTATCSLWDYSVSLMYCTWATVMCSRVTGRWKLFTTPLPCPKLLPVIFTAQAVSVLRRRALWEEQVLLFWSSSSLGSLVSFLSSKRLVSPTGSFISLCKSKTLVPREANKVYVTKDTPKGIAFTCPEIDFDSAWGSGHN